MSKQAKITIRRHPDIEGDNNRGWQVDLLSAWVGQDLAGYAAIAFIPAERLKRHYPQGAWDWLRLIEGRSHLPEKKPPAHEAKQILSQRHLENWKFFKAYFVEKPRMDMIRVLSEHDRSFRYGAQLGLEGPLQHQFSFRGRGIGLLLYREAARWMAEAYGCPLYASDLRSPDANRAWTRLKAALPEAVQISDRPLPKGADRPQIKAEGRYMLLGDRIEPWRPDWAQDLEVLHTHEASASCDRDFASPAGP